MNGDSPPLRIEAGVRNDIRALEAWFDEQWDWEENAGEGFLGDLEDTIDQIEGYPRGHAFYDDDFRRRYLSA